MELLFETKISVDEEFSKEIKKEANFQTYLGKKFVEAGFVYFKLSDADQVSLKPCDCIITDNNGITHRVELKICEGDTININCLEGQQKGYLLKVHYRGGSGLVIVYSKKHKSYKIYNIKSFLDSGNNVGTVNIFGKKKKDIKVNKKEKEKFSEEKMVDNIPL